MRRLCYILFLIAVIFTVGVVDAFRTGVVIGDSIAASSNECSRIWPTTNLSKDCPTGCFSGELQNNLTKFTWYNNGRSGDTTTKVYDRWYRDAVGADVDIGDGITHPTLQKKPDYVITFVGINDILHGWYYADFGDTMRNNLYKMATNSSQNGQKVIFVTMLPNDPQGPIKVINAWMLENLTTIPNIRIYNSAPLMDNGTYHIKQVYDSGDGLHPNAAGFAAMSAEIYAQNKDIIGYSGRDEFTIPQLLIPNITPTPSLTQIPNQNDIISPSITRIERSGANVQRFPDSNITTTSNGSIVSQESTDPNYPKQELYYGYIRSMRWDNYCRIEHCDDTACNVVKADSSTRNITVTRVQISIINNMALIPNYEDIP